MEAKINKQKLIIEAFKDGYKTTKDVAPWIQQKYGTTVNPRTVNHNIKEVFEKNKLSDLRLLQRPTEKGMEYKLMTVSNISNPKMLDYLMARYKNAYEQENSLVSFLQTDIVRESHYNKIYEEQFILFLIKYAKEKPEQHISFLIALSNIAKKLRMEIRYGKKVNKSKEKSLLELIEKSTLFINDIVKNRTFDIEKRVKFFELVPSFSLKRAVDLGFHLYTVLDTKQTFPQFKKDKVKKHDSEFDFFKQIIRKAFLNYIEVDKLYCRKKIDDTLEQHNVDMLPLPILNEVLDLRYFIAPGYEEEKSQARFQAINIHKAAKIERLETILKKKGTSLEEILHEKGIDFDLKD